jgi:MOSC domain-containing protein YiiM
MTGEAFDLRAVLTGPVKPLGPRAFLSGIDKSAVFGSFTLTKTEFVGGAQGDPLRHGGPEKAAHHYPSEHYAAWRAEFGWNDNLDRPGAFGEILSTAGLTEETVAIGDVFEVGKALIEVSQGRQPCWKLNERFRLREMAKLVQSSGRIGWYSRVLREGAVGPDDRMKRLHRHSSDWTISRIWRIFYVDTLNQSELAGLSKMEQLAIGCREYDKQGCDGSCWAAVDRGPDRRRQRGSAPILQSHRLPHLSGGIWKDPQGIRHRRRLTKPAEPATSMDAAVGRGRHLTAKKPGPQFV